MFEKILVAIDGSEGSKKALAAAFRVAKKFGAELQSISVKERPSHYSATVGEVMEDQEAVDKFFAHVAEEALDWAEREGVILQCEVRPGHEVQTIVEFAGRAISTCWWLGSWVTAACSTGSGGALRKILRG